MNNTIITQDQLNNVTPEELLGFLSANQTAKQEASNTEVKNQQVALDVSLAASTADALRGTTHEQASEIVHIWGDIRDAIDKISRYNRTMLIHQAMADSEFDMQEATRVPKALLESLNEQLEDLDHYTVESKGRSDLLNKHLGGIAASNRANADICKQQITYARKKIISSKSDREASYEKLLQMKVPEHIASTVATPTLDDVADLEQLIIDTELRMKKHRDVAVSHSLQAAIAFPEPSAQ